ncbi:MAG TPA: ABC transporter substrate-binding protein [Thermomicrobiales bacterium]|nr:ABC transporter substrate-binding protein [Thermomicrobiales bacterium]
MRDNTHRRRRFGRGLRLQLLGALVLALVASGVGQALAQDLGTIEPGKLIVAFNGDMPMTSVKDGKFVGTDAEMISMIADQLGLQIEPQQMEWSAEIESTKAGRVDLMLGAMGWTKERSEVMRLTDPIYYFGTLLTQKNEHNWSTFADLAGKKVGTVTGFTLVPELKSVPNIGEVRLYDTSDAVMRDLVTGRLDIAILDPPLVSLALKEHPEWNLHQVALQPDPKYPIMSTTYNVVMGIRQDAKGLEDAVNGKIDQLWADCENQKIMAQYGVTDPSFFLPPNPNPRVGVDRPADWVSPTLGKDCAAAATPAAS